LILRYAADAVIIEDIILMLLFAADIHFRYFALPCLPLYAIFSSSAAADIASHATPCRRIC